MTVCSKCLIEKPLEDFPIRSDRRSGRGTVCLACGRAYRRAHYAQNVAYYVEKARRSGTLQRTRTYERFVEYLRLHPCVDCAEADVRVLQFDHIDPRTKTTAVSLLVRSGAAWDSVLREIEKCEVRCGNCHRHARHSVTSEFVDAEKALLRREGPGNKRSGG